MTEESQDPKTALNNALKEANDKLKSLPPPKQPKDEINFDDISSDSEVDENVNKDSDSDDVSPEPEEKLSVDERLTRAESSKMTGNDFFKKNENKEALKFYTKGSQVLEPLEKEVLPVDYKEKYEQLYCSLFLNKSAASNREKDFKESIRCCSKVLKKAEGKDELNNSYIKALLRRGVAYIARNEMNSAKNDFLRVLQFDSKNKDALRELRKIKQALVEEKKRAKSTFGSIFDKNVNIYKDKEEEIKLREAKRRKEKAVKEREYGKEKFTSDDPDSFMTFEEWEKAKEKKQREKEKKEQEEKDRKAREREERRRKKVQEERQKKIDAGIDPDKDDIELDDEDLAAIADVKKKGYCHFRREKTQDEKDLLSNIAPSKLTNGAQSITKTDTVDSDHSAWNNAKTWEEKDVTEQVRGDLKAQLKNVVMNSGEKDISMKIYVDKVSSVSGEAQVVFVSGKKGTIYDMNVELKFKCSFVNKDEEDKEKNIKGTLKFPEIANGTKEHNFEASSSFSKLETLNPQEKKLLQAFYPRFEEHIREKIFYLVEGQFSGSTS